LLKNKHVTKNKKGQFIRISYGGKAGGIDHFSPERIDHLLPELIYYQLIYFNIDMKTGEMWSICPAFAIFKMFDFCNKSFDICYSFS
jgi:hypothetical protein